MTTVHCQRLSRFAINIPKEPSFPILESDRIFMHVRTPTPRAFLHTSSCEITVLEAAEVSFRFETLYLHDPKNLNGFALFTANMPFVKFHPLIRNHGSLHPRLHQMRAQTSQPVPNAACLSLDYELPRKCRSKGKIQSEMVALAVKIASKPISSTWDRCQTRAGS